MLGWREGVVTSIFLAVASLATAQGSNAVCKAQSPLVNLSTLPEASGLAVGRSAARLWTHNDSGAPELIALDPKGSIAGRLTGRGHGGTARRQTVAGAIADDCANWNRVRFSFRSRSWIWTGRRIERERSAIARVIAWRIHHVA